MDGKITFFSSCTKQEGGSENVESDIWDFLYLDCLWESVLENYYSICNVSPERKSLAMDLYVKKKKISSHVKPTKTQSYADLMSKIGLPLQSVGHKAPKMQECGSGKRALGSDGLDSMQNTGGPLLDEDDESATNENNLIKADAKDSREDSLRVFESSTSGINICHDKKDSAEGKQGADGENSNDCCDVHDVTGANNRSKKESICGKDVDKGYDSGGKKADEGSEGQNVADDKDKKSTYGTDITDKKSDTDNDTISQTTSCSDTNPLPFPESNAAAANNKTAVSKTPLVPVNLFSKNLSSSSKNLDETFGDKKDGVEPTSKKSKKADYDIVKLDVDRLCMEKIGSVPEDNWCIEDDMELVRFLSDVSDLSSKGRCKVRGILYDMFQPL